MDRVEVTYRWMEGAEAVEALNPVLAMRGWMALNDQTSRALGAYQNGELIEAFVLQLVPLVGPLIKTDNTHRDNGAVTRELVRQMHEWLDQIEARGYITVCESPISERLAVRHGMTKIKDPVYVEVA